MKLKPYRWLVVESNPSVGFLNGGAVQADFATIHSLFSIPADIGGLIGWIGRVAWQNAVTDGSSLT